MSFRNRVFVVLVCFVTFPLLIAFVAIDGFLSARLKSDFNAQLVSHGELVSRAFSRLEQLHQNRGEVALRQLEREMEIWASRSNLQAFRDRFQLTLQRARTNITM